MTTAASEGGTAGAAACAPRRGRRRVFISYRRADGAGHADRLYDSLRAHFGHDRVFMDIDGILAGEDFVERIRRELESCLAVVVVIGRNWLRPAGGGQGQDEAQPDYVRMEVGLALALGARTIPVLVNGVQMPLRSELPDDLKPLAQLNAIELNRAHFEAAVNRVIAAIEPDRRWWRGRLTLAAAAALALAAALFVQYRLAYGPQRVSLTPASPLSSVAAHLGHDELLIERPQTDSDEGLLLAHYGREGEFIDINFERARLGGETLRRLALRRPPDAAPPPHDAARLTFETLPPEAPPAGPRPGGQTCRTSFEIHAAEAGLPPSALRLYQTEAAGGERARRFGLKAAGGDLRFRVETVPPPDAAREALGCRKRLGAGDVFEHLFSGLSTVYAVAEDGGGVNLSFNVASLKEGAAGLFPPFEMVAAAQPGGPAPLRAGAVHLRPLSGDTKAPATFSLTADGQPLSIDNLEVGPDLIRLRVSGLAVVEDRDGNHFKLRDRLALKSRAFALFALLDLALVLLLVWLLLGARR
ncbi:MAG TPA: toll/interleukin-1 receptor domain-containing protein [Pyrinomonadaceae bacterium]|nr:toll/interleukin-1 receptor domain-containing protein [Pyrinomonadaceae bacterium]